MESMNAELAEKTVKDFCCSNCWGELELAPDLRGNGLYFVTCQKCKEETKGYVTKYFANRRRIESEFEAREAIRVLRKMGVLPDPNKGKSRAELLKEIGF